MDATHTDFDKAAWLKWAATDGGLVILVNNAARGCEYSRWQLGYIAQQQTMSFHSDPLKDKPATRDSLRFERDYGEEF